MATRGGVWAVAALAVGPLVAVPVARAENGSQPDEVVPLTVEMQAFLHDQQPNLVLHTLHHTPCVDGQADGYPCHNVDLEEFMPLAEIGGGAGNDLWGWTDPETGHEYALMGRSTGTSFVDVTDPENPIYLGDLPTHTVQLLLARHQDRRQLRLHRQRGEQPRHAGVRPQPAPRRRQPAGDLH